MSLVAFFGAPVQGPSTPPPAPRPSSIASMDVDQQAPSAVKSKPLSGSKKSQGAAKTKTSSAKKAVSTPTKKGVKGTRKKVYGKHSKVISMGKGSVTSEWKLLRQVGVKVPKSAYTLWSGENRKRIQAELGTTDFATVSKAVGEAWAKLTEEQKKPYAENANVLRGKYMEAQAAYGEYLATTIKRDTKARENKKNKTGPRVLLKPLNKFKTLQQQKKAVAKAAKAKVAKAKAAKALTAKTNKGAKSPSSAKTRSGKGAGAVSGDSSTPVAVDAPTKALAAQEEDTVHSAVEPAEAVVAQVATPVKRSMRSFRIPKDDEPAPNSLGEMPAAEEAEDKDSDTMQVAEAEAPGAPDSAEEAEDKDSDTMQVAEAEAPAAPDSAEAAQ